MDVEGAVLGNLQESLGQDVAVGRGEAQVRLQPPQPGQELLLRRRRSLKPKP